MECAACPIIGKSKVIGVAHDYPRWFDGSVRVTGNRLLEEQ